MGPASKLSGALWQCGEKRKETIFLLLGELATMSLEFEFYLQFPCGSLSTELWAQSGNQRECKQTLKNAWKHVPRVMMLLLMSSLPISISHWLFQCRYSNCREVVVSSPSFSRPATRLPWRACSQAILGTVNLLTPMIWLVIVFSGCYFYFI